MRLAAGAITFIAALAWSACAAGTASPTRTAVPHTTPSPPVASRTAAPTATLAASSATAQPRATWTPAPTGDSGIDGRVTIGPTCPVQRIDSPCPDRPYEVTLTVLDGSMREVAQTRSDSSGHFRLMLSPGTYTLRPPMTGVSATARGQTVEVAEGRFTEVQIVFDSGIR